MPDNNIICLVNLAYNVTVYKVITKKTYTLGRGGRCTEYKHFFLFDHCKLYIWHSVFLCKIWWSKSNYAYWCWYNQTRSSSFRERVCPVASCLILCLRHVYTLKGKIPQQYWTKICYEVLVIRRKHNLIYQNPCPLYSHSSPREHNRSTQCRISAGPSSTTLAQHWSDIGLMYCVCWALFLSHNHNMSLCQISTPEEVGDPWWPSQPFPVTVSEAEV